MSAIAGVLQYGGGEETRSVYHQGLTMMSALAEFPADDIRTWSNRDLFLGCHAQWVTPESVREALPYYEEKQGLAITADVILDNREELAAKLGIRTADLGGYPDSRLLLLAYTRWGVQMPKQLIGDFAFMIWDERERRLFGARDFSGNRTLYYDDTGERFAFCTLIRPLLCLPGARTDLNEAWVAEYIGSPSRLETIDAGSTVYRRIRQVPPSHAITVHNGRVHLTRYASPEPSRPLKLSSDREYEEAFLDVFSQAVRSRLRTCKQVGSFLSGGLDSGAVVSLAARELGREGKILHTYSSIPLASEGGWTSKTRLADERPMIRQTVEHVGNIRDRYLRFEDRSPLSEMDGWLDTMEMPYKFIENSYWFGGIFEQARADGVGVLLNGARGNYTVSFGPAIEYYAKLFKQLRWARLYREMYRYSRFKGTSRKNIARRIRDQLLPSSVYAGERSELTRLIAPGLAERTGLFDRLRDAGVDLSGRAIPDMIAARAAQFEQVHHWTNSGTSGTKLSLRHGVWYRDPTNDLRVVRFCLSVPLDQYVRDGMDRALIRRATAGLLPDSVRLNGRTRGIQGADGIARLTAAWPAFIGELERAAAGGELAEWIHMPVLRETIARYKDIPGPQAIYEPGFTLLMRSLILGRFIGRLKGGETNEQGMEAALIGSA
ncbi:asparagine synthase-related protein [Cohnella sp. 56]|uniref:asparagine synthase-related protein n=1 Tax=Cohnella sp. 56 TaxID=3113722 RepID=UPI0030E93ABC